MHKCRLCLSLSPDILKEIWEGCEILDKLATCLSHFVIINKDLPNKICNHCHDKIEDIYKFHQAIRQNETKLQWELKNIIICSEISDNTEIKLENEDSDNNYNGGYHDNEDENINQVLEPKIEENPNQNIINDEQQNDENNIESQNVKRENVEDNLDNGINDNSKIANLELNGMKRFMCLTCFEVFTNQLELLRHYQNVELEKYNKNNTDSESKPVKYNVYTDDNGLYYKCERCYKKYRQKYYIKRHVLSHIERRPFLCKLCGKTYQTASIIVSHGKMHTGDIYRCSHNCGYTSVHKHVVKNHEKGHKGEFKYKCQTCGKGFQVKSWYQQHQNIHDGVKPFSCDLCGMTFHLHRLCHTCVSGRSCHRGHKRTASLHHVCFGVAGTRILLGNPCRRYLTTHKSNVHPQTSVRKPWVCKQCSYPCDSKNSLNLHLKDKHGIEIKKSNLCDICGKVLRDSQQLKLHKRAVHLNIKPFVCGICNKSFPKKYTLKNHEQTHKGKPFLCNLCDKLFAKDVTLQKHKQRCHTESKYKCDNCEKTFTSKLKLTAHLKNCNLADE